MSDAASDARFGANAWVVEEMRQRYLRDPRQVGESWRAYFEGRAPAADGDDGGERPTRPTPARPEAEREVDHAGPAAAGDAGGAPEPVAAPTQPAGSPFTAADPEDAPGDDEPVERLRGVSARIAENMNDSRSVPTATSIREVPAKLLEVNRRVINNQLKRDRGGKLSFTHLIGYAVVRALADVPAMRNRYREVAGRPHVSQAKRVGLGLAVDVERDDGTRVLLVPVVHDADTLDFAGFWDTYEDRVGKVQRGELTPEMFEGVTVTLTNPGTIGTVGSVPRLMRGQSAIIGVGRIDHPAEWRGADPRVLAELGVGKVITVSSTYDHRVVQGAESGLFLKRVEELLLGEHGFYDEVFRSLGIPYEPVRWRADDNTRVVDPAEGARSEADKQVAVQKLINMYRARGHLIANLNPLRREFKPVHPDLDPATYGLSIWDLDREFATGGVAGRDRMRLSEALMVLRDAYCRTLGVEYTHIQPPEQKRWIQERVERVAPADGTDPDELRRILQRLNAAEAFEKFLHTKFIGHKRFSLEGAESAIPMLDTLFDAAADHGIRHAAMGMAHRGRLNVLVNVLHKDMQRVFREFEGDIDPDSVQGSGDVKYHLGTTGVHTSPAGNEVRVRLSSNPSHLEAVNPVVEGMARAMIDQATDDPEGDAGDHVLPVLVHGDAAFAGQGVVQETLAMSQLPGYRTGGTVHLVINNQLGFTTGPEQARSSVYATDVAKMVQAPILHVNGDDPEACVRAMRLAFEFRQTFGCDVVVDLVCYRRWGHNEGDDPSYTQPVMYRAIEERPSTREMFTAELVDRGVLTSEEAEQALEDFRGRLERSLRDTRESHPPSLTESLPGPTTTDGLPTVETGVGRSRLELVLDRVTSAPEGFTIHPRLARQLGKRRGLLDADRVDWSMAEAFAFGSLLLEGFPVRLAGQDSRRGTFSQRHSVLVDHDTGAEHVPLASLSDEQASFTAFDSLLSEYAAVGFEYGYSVERPDALVLWEAQFGDFVNGAQIVIDQFIASAEDKWGQPSGLVLLLPHGYEGQGPEHSSARLERFLILCATGNMQVAQPSTAAQYFHLLRRQMHRDVRKPLVVLTPKSMLRAKAAASPAEAFTDGRFREVFDDPTVDDDGPGLATSDVRRVLLCTGKVAHQLRAERDERGASAAVVRLEQLYPFPARQLAEALGRLGRAEEIVWVQEEPENMGAWTFVRSRIEPLLASGQRLEARTRPPSASPATGSQSIHEHEQALLIDGAFEGL